MVGLQGMEGSEAGGVLARTDTPRAAGTQVFTFALRVEPDPQ
jgi:hypothetical protein